MNKSKYEIELNSLGSTYKWSLETDIGRLKTAVEASLDFPIIAIGSGGSLTVANVISLLHAKFTGQNSCYMTPLEFLITYDNISRDVGIFLFTSGGRNSDVLSIFKEIVYREPCQITVVCGTKNAPISNIARKYKHIHFIELENPPFRKDGYLATNSLLAFSTILTRAYLSIFDSNSSLPPSLEDLLYDGNFSEYLAGLTRKLRPLLTKRSIAVLYGGWSRPAAFDLESKFTEAALGNISISDYRNFGHGRHYWLARYGDETGILAFVDSETIELAKRTLDLIPPDILTLELSTNYDGAIGCLAHLCNVLYAVKIAGDLKGIDPAKPGVPKFGRRLYSLRIKTSEMPMYNLLSKSWNRHLVAVLRKVPQIYRDDKLLKIWIKAHSDFVNKLRRVEFGAIVLDYDGTLCDPEERFQGPSDEIIGELTRLLEAGIIIGVATGRGKSVRRDLQRKIPREFWDRVFIGYYNGSDIAELSNSKHPIKSKDLDPTIESINEFLEDSWLRDICKWEVRSYQISIIEIKKPFTVRRIRNILADLIRQEGVQVLESLHSVDILAPGTSKRSIVDVIRRICDGEVLCIGDKGKYPGNDYELLSETYSLSVYEVSPDPDTCWNIASPGYRFTQATLEYLESMIVKNGRIRFKFRGVKNERHTS